MQLRYGSAMEVDEYISICSQKRHFNDKWGLVIIQHSWINYLLCWPFLYRSKKSSWYSCIYWYLYIQKMTDESDTTPFYKKQPALHLHWLFHGWWIHWVQATNYISQVTLRNLISALTRNRKFILCGWTSNEWLRTSCGVV